jgi:hypothetical protein
LHGEGAAFYLLHAAGSLVGQLLLMLVLQGELSILSLTLLLSHNTFFFLAVLLTAHRRLLSE